MDESFKNFLVMKYNGILIATAMGVVKGELRSVVNIKTEKVDKKLQKEVLKDVHTYVNANTQARGSECRIFIKKS